MGEQGTIGAVELAAGVPFPAWALEPLRFAVNNHNFQEIALFGRAYKPEEALAMGLIDEVCPGDRLLTRCIERAHELARVPRPTFAATKGMLRAQAVAAANQSAADTDDAIKAAWKSPVVLDAVRDRMNALKGSPSR
jgi:enoyl-CoA hydratase